ncbi:MAG: type IV pilus assembly protein PilM [Candidatus Pacebacteria bacterium]|nr:type IV pilus assembly protein PilM [Candidatus Paceibacterota bacterium]
MKFNFFKKMLSIQDNSYLGVDIGTTSIKVVELMKTKGLPFLKTYGFLESYGHLERLNNAIQTSTLKMLEAETAELLKAVVKQSGAETRQAVASLPSFTAFSTLLELPIMSDIETAQAMAFQVKQYVPLPVGAVTIDWIKVGERKDENGTMKQQIFLVSIPNEVINKYKSIFEKAGLNLMALELEGFSTARVLTSEAKENTLIIDIGSRSTTILVAKEGNLKFAGQTDFAGGSLTQTLSSGLSIRTRRAEDLKKRRGLTGSGGEYELSTLMLPILDVILSEVKRVRNNFESTCKESVEKVILTGGGANLLGIEEYFSEQLGLPAVKASPFAKVDYPNLIEPFVKDLGPIFTVAIGLGIKNL